MVKQDHLDYISKIEILREKSKQLNDVIKYYESQDFETKGFRNDLADVKYKIKELQSVVTPGFYKYLGYLNSTDSFTFTPVTDNYMALRDILVCIIRKKQVTVSDVIDAFMLTHKLGQPEYMNIFYKKFKTLWKTSSKGTEDYENVDWVFYTLIDSEVSLKAGCMNEFLAG